MHDLAELKLGSRFAIISSFVAFFSIPFHKILSSIWRRTGASSLAVEPKLRAPSQQAWIVQKNVSLPWMTRDMTQRNLWTIRIEGLQLLLQPERLSTHPVIEISYSDNIIY